jgi:hypothetical protein
VVDGRLGIVLGGWLADGEAGVMDRGGRLGEDAANDYPDDIEDDPRRSFTDAARIRGPRFAA